MNKILIISIITVLIYSTLLGQNKNSLEELKTQFQTFNYSKVISEAESLLANKSQFSDKEIIEIYLIKGISHYTLGQSELMEISFYEILNLNNNYKINSRKVSPKIITKFEKLQLEYGRFISNKESLITVKIDTLYRVDTLLIKPNNNLYSATVVRSLVFSGWGHLYSGNKTKGLILTSASAITLSSMLYFIFDTNNKRSKYLSEISPSQIEKKYKDYNTSYKIRNSLIATYALIWIYTQIDILFLSEIPFVPEVSTANMNNFQYSLPRDIQLSFQFKF